MNGLSRFRRLIMESQQDSKVARYFLRRVLGCLGRKVPQELEINSHALYEVIEKDISVVLTDLKRAKGNIRNLVSGDVERRQFTLQAIGDFYDKGKERQAKAEYESYKMEREEEDKVDQLIDY